MMMWPFYDGTMLLLIPAILLSLYAQYKVSATFRRFSAVPNRKGYTGADVARMLLDKAGVHDVRIERTAGNLTDHYDPRDKVLRLSDAVYSSASLAAIGVAAHETGHAVQHDNMYFPLNLRNTIFPVVSISSQLAMPLIFLGLFLSSGRGGLGMLMLQAGIVLFSAVVMFQLVTLPVEFNASRRAITMLEDTGFLTDDEIAPAKKVLNAAALTYVAAALTAVLNLIRFILLSQRRR